MSFQNPLTKLMVGFIRDKGIELIPAELEADTFIPGIYISQGKLFVDESKLLYPGDLLHEAGHIALIPSNLRQYASGNVEQIKEIGDSYEIESIAWSWAAVVELEIAPEILFHAQGYKGNHRGLLTNFQLGVYIGVKRLEDFGMAYTARKAMELGKKSYPHMHRWLRV